MTTSVRFVVSLPSWMRSLLTVDLDMVLEDVTELYANIINLGFECESTLLNLITQRLQRE